MKRILALALIALLLTGCSKSIDVGMLSLGQNKTQVETTIKESHCNIESEWGNSMRIGGGNLSLLGITWDSADCKYSDGRLVAVTMLKKLSQTPEFEIQCVKSRLRELCGDGYSRGLIAVYGTDSDNKGLLGGIKADIDDDLFFAMIHLMDMAQMTKRLYTIRDVSSELGIPASTLRYWESVFPMLDPKRTEKGQRRYVNADLDLCRQIQDLLHNRGMKIETARECLLKSYRRYAPRNPYVCRSANDALNLLRDVTKMLPDKPHATERLKSVMEWIEKDGQN